MDVSNVGSRFTHGFVGPVMMLTLASIATGPVVARGAVPSIEALSTTDPIVVDGVLDEAVWQSADVGTGFTQREPEQFEPATEATEIRVVYDQNTLYVGVLAHDADPSALIARELGRDVALYRDDSVAVLLDTFHDRRNAYFFETNPVSSRTDGYVTDEGRFSTEWDGIWTVKSRVFDGGWAAEFAIPIRTLRFDPAGTTWGLQVRRYIRHKNEITFWSPIGRDASIFRISKAGLLTGLTGLETSRDLRIKPYATTMLRRSRDPDTGVSEDEEDAELGLDVKWGVTRGLTLDLTANTDFAETEVDEQQVNLTRFSLFLPEKREFFLENAGIFDFGPDLGSQLKVFFSRRIGIGDGGRPTPLDFGGRLAGRQGPWSIGVMGARTGSLAQDLTGGLDPVLDTDWGVVRLKRNLGERSTLGVIATERRIGDGRRNRVWGVDGAWKPTDRLELWAFSTESTGDDAGSDGWAGGLGGEFQGDFWRWQARVLEIEETYDPQVGFVPRKGIRAFVGEVEWLPRPEWEGVRNLSFEAETEVFTLEDGTLETVEATLDLFAIKFDNGDYFSVFGKYRFEELFEPFDIFDGIILPAAEYEWLELGVFLSTSDSRSLSLEGFAVKGDFFEGERLVSDFTLRWRPSAQWSLATTWHRNDIEVAAGAFETNVWRQRVRYAWNADVDANLFLQYNDAAELAALNLRLSWQYRPGSDLFVVYNQTWDAPDLGDLADRDRQLAVKLTYSWGA